MTKLSDAQLADRLAMMKITLPSEEELEERSRIRFEESKSNPNQFGFWFSSVIKVLDDPTYTLGVRYPRTNTVPFAKEGSDSVLKEDLDAVNGSPSIKAAVEMIEAAFDEFGTDELFIKNGLFSAKHSWNDTCYVKRDSDLTRHVANIMYEWFFGSGNYPVEFVVRELIPTKPVFHAFRGTPITQEFRFFSKDGQTYAYQPYWPLEAFNRSTNEPDVAKKLAEINGEPEAELMQAMTATAGLITQELGGDWSVDFLIDEDGKPWLIDMAITSQSYHSPDLRKIG